ncbi:GIY-YIG nuclease family protein [Nocardia sp. NPDC005366]|uniref:GIY-YIG nuclease family protein n=1 Tax=Nocardia sp. NPDC005366 TaxID=3156878 RepID=UPI0033A4AEBD
MSVGRTVRLYLADGTSGGLLTAEIMNWTGHVVAAPRSDLAALLRRPEADRTGVYILLGDNPDSASGVEAYIGEGDSVGKRIAQHSRPQSEGGRDFWVRAIVLTSKDANLTKAHARYLEARLIAIATEAGRAVILNKTAPEPLPLPEADVSDMEYFIGQVNIVLPVLGVDLLRSVGVTRPATVGSDSQAAGPMTSPVFEMRVQKHGIEATAQEIDGEFTVFEGSNARSAWFGSDSGYGRLREKLLDNGTIVASADEANCLFTRNCVFASPSAAAAVVSGHNANGRLVWRVRGQAMTLGEWQDRGIDSPAE